MTPELLPVGCWSCDLATAETDPVDWLWHGLLAAGNVTLLTGLWKAGKTTLLSLLLARRQHGGSLAGLAVKPGKTVIVTEEHRSLWAERVRRLGLRDGICLFSRPFDSIPRPEEWQALIARILQLRDSDAVDLAVIDPLAPFLQRENSPRAIFQSLLPLAALTRQGMAI